MGSCLGASLRPLQPEASIMLPCNLNYLITGCNDSLTQALLPPKPPLTHLTPPPSEILPFLSCLPTYIHYTATLPPTPLPQSRDPSFPNTSPAQRTAIRTVACCPILPPSTHTGIATCNYICMFTNLVNFVRSSGVPY